MYFQDFRITKWTHRLQTMMMTTKAMRKTNPAAAEPMMSGSFSWMLVLYSSIKKGHIDKPNSMHAHTHSHTEPQAETYGKASEPLQWVADWHTAGWTNEHLGISTGCTQHFTNHIERAEMLQIWTNHLVESVWNEGGRGSIFGWETDWSDSQEWEN